MDFNRARTFIEVVDCGGITLAANRLLRTQQAISLQLQQLEAELQLNLFHRQGPKITLTDDGDKLYKLFKPQLLAMESALLELKSGKRQARGLIRIGLWMEQAVNYLPEMIRIFKQEFPQVEFSLTIAEDAEIERLLETNQLDLGLQLYCQDHKLFKAEAVYRQAMIPVISRSYLKNAPAANSVADTLNMPLLDYAPQYSAYQQWVKKNARQLLPKAQKKVPAITTSNNLVLKQLVLQGLGFSFLHRESIEAELNTGELRPLLNNPSAQNIYVELDLVHKRKHSLGFVQQQFVQLLLEQKSSWMQH
ncbi:MAG: LysR family transcriptional regulator [Pseudomonadales bacterium]|nr:LysR family transcriptional regulator [Pseudomonadales bacterium]